MNAVDSAVRHWRRRVGPCVVFDADDARQEAALACWQSGKDMAVVGYRGILDAMRRLMPGFRQHAQPVHEEIEDTRTHDDSPEAIVSAWQTLAAIERGEVAQPEPKPAQAAPEPEEDPAYAALRAEARAASLLYSQAMR